MWMAKQNLLQSKGLVEQLIWGLLNSEWVVDKLRGIVAAVISLVFFMAVGPSAPIQEVFPADRVILEINSNVYTQRMLEIYLILRGALGSDRVVSDIEVVSEKNWKSALDAFIDEMLVLQEAQRTGSFSASGKTIDGALQMIDEALKRHPSALARLAGLDVDANQKMRMVSWILKVEGFRRSKSRQGQDESSVTVKEKKGLKTDWVKELQERAVVRTLDGATTYRPIGWPVNSAPK